MNVQKRASFPGSILVLTILLAVAAAFGAGPASSTEGWERPTATAEEAVIVSPGEGFFLASESPGGEPFVQPGDPVGKATLVGYIQSMERTPVVAGVEGRITEVVARDMTPVSRGDVLFRVQLLD